MPNSNPLKKCKKFPLKKLGRKFLHTVLKAKNYNLLSPFYANFLRGFATFLRIRTRSGDRTIFQSDEFTQPRAAGN
jgi:hypothetical protein